MIDKCRECDKHRSIHNFKGCLYRVKQINLHRLQIKLDGNIGATVVRDSVYPHHFSSHKKVADQNFKPLP
jgi:hypothetical protein